MENIIKVWAILKNKCWKILIFKEYSNKENKDLYNIPKWTVDKEDINLNCAIKREIYEETNILNINIINTLNVYVKNNGNYNSILVLFEIMSLDESVKNNNIKDNEKIWQYLWISKADFIKMNKDEFIDDRIYLVIKDYFKNE